MPRDPLDLKTLDEVQAATGLGRLDVLRAIADERLRVVWLGLNPAVPAAELDRFAGELELKRPAA
jgi:hypothetical protein